MAIPQQNHAKSRHFHILQVDWLLTAVFFFGASYAGGRRRTDARTPCFFTQVVWLEPACNQHCEPARILWWSCWFLNVGYTQRSDGKSRIESDLNFHLKKKWPSNRRFFHIHQSEDGCFLLSTTSIFFYTSGGYETCNRTDRSDLLGVIVAWIWTWQQDAQSM